MSEALPNVADMNANRDSATRRRIAVDLQNATRAVETAEAAVLDLLADAAELGIRRAYEMGATSWRETEKHLRALSEVIGATVNESPRTVRRRMNDALLDRRSRENSRIPAVFKRPRNPRPMEAVRIMRSCAPFDKLREGGEPTVTEPLAGH